MIHAFKSFLSLWGSLSVAFLLCTAALATSTVNLAGFASSLMNCPGIFGYTGPTPPTTTCFTPPTAFFTQTTSFTLATPSVTGQSISLPPCVLENNTLSPLGCTLTTSSSHHSRPDHPHHSKPAHHSKPSHQTGVNPLPWVTVPPEAPSTVPCSGDSAATCWLIKGTTYTLDTAPTLGTTYTVGPILPSESEAFPAGNLPSKTAAQITPLPSAAVNPVPCAANPAMLCVSQNGQIHTVGTIRPRQIQDGIAEPSLSMSVSGNTVPYPPSLSPRPCTADSTYACLPFGTSEKTVGTLLPVGPGAPTSTTATPQTSLATSSGFQNTASTASQTSLATSSGFQNTATTTSQTSSVPLTTATVVNATTALPPSSSLTGTSASSSSSAPTTTSKKSGSSRSIKTSMILMLTCCIISLSANCLSMRCSPIASQKTTSAPSQKSISSKTFRLPLMLLFFSSVISLARGQSITNAPPGNGIFGNISISTCTGASPDCLVIDGTTMELSASLTVTYITPTDIQSSNIPPCVNGLTPPGCYIPDTSTDPTLTPATTTAPRQSIGVSVTTSITSSALPSVSGPPWTCGANSSMMCISIPTESSPAWNSSPAETSTTSSFSAGNRTSTSTSQPTQKSQAMSLRKFQNPFLFLVGVIVASAFVSLFGSEEEPSKDKETDSAVEKKTQRF